MGDLQTPFTAPTCPTPTGAGDGGGTSGGFDMGEGSQKESSNMSGLPALQTTVNPGEGAPGSKAVAPGLLAYTVRVGSGGAASALARTAARVAGFLLLAGAAPAPSFTMPTCFGEVLPV